MAAVVGLFRQPCLHSSFFPNLLKSNVSSISSVQLRSFSLYPRSLPLTQTSLPHIRGPPPPPPRNSVLSKLTSFRPFSTPTKKTEKHENIYTIPNILTFSRLLATPIIAYLILHDFPYLATSLLFYAGLTDLVDGWIARRYNLQSVVGTVIDPMADKFLMVTLTGALAYTGAMPGMALF
jgi:cardiolipin synthase (CMP-forming)